MNTTTASDANETTVALLNDAQEVSLALLSIISALLSILGSSLILRLILQPPQPNASSNIGRRKVLDNTYDRLLFGMSVADLLISVTSICFPFLVPASTSRRIWAVGTHGTCQAMATTYTWASSSFWYSACLSFYFLLLLRQQVPGRTVARKYEPWMHALSIGWPLLFGITGIFLGVYHELRMGPGCSVVGYPIFGYLALALPLLLGMVSVTVNNILIVAHVRRIVQKSKRWTASSVFSSAVGQSQRGGPNDSQSIQSTSRAFDHHSQQSLEQPNSKAFSAAATETSVAFTAPSTTAFANSVASTTPSTTAFVNLSSEAAEQPQSSSRPGLRRTRSSYFPSLSLPQSLQGSTTSPSDETFQMVAGQSALYVLSIYAVYIWPLARSIAGTMGVRSEQDVYWLLLLQCSLMPLQGFWNVLIYCRPRYLSRRHRHAQIESRWVSLRCAALGTNNTTMLKNDNNNHTRSSATGELPVGNNNHDDEDGGILDHPAEDDCEAPLPSKEDYYGKARMIVSNDDDDRLSNNKADPSAKHHCEEQSCDLEGESQGLSGDRLPDQDHDNHPADPPCSSKVDTVEEGELSESFAFDIKSDQPLEGDDAILVASLQSILQDMAEQSAKDLRHHRYSRDSA